MKAGDMVEVIAGEYRKAQMRILFTPLAQDRYVMCQFQYDEAVPIDRDYLREHTWSDALIQELQ